MDYSELKRLAEAARDSIGMGLNAQILAVHAFEDQTSPDVVLGLLAELETRKAYGDEQTQFAIDNANQRDTLRTQNQALLEALKNVMYWDNDKPEWDMARAAIKLAEETDV